MDLEDGNSEMLEVSQSSQLTFVLCLLYTMSGPTAIKKHARKPIG